MGTFLQFKDFQDFWGECSSKAACYQAGLITFAHIFYKKNSVCTSQIGADKDWQKCNSGTGEEKGAEQTSGPVLGLLESKVLHRDGQRNAG